MLINIIFGCLKKKRNRCKTKCGYHTMTKLYIIYYRLLRKFNFYKEQLYNILSCEFRILIKDLVNSSCSQRVHKFYQNSVEWNFELKVNEKLKY